MSDKTEEKIIEIFQSVFFLGTSEVSSLTRDNSDKWDSMAQTSIILCLEEEFNLQIDFDTSEELDSFEYIVAFIQSKL